MSATALIRRVFGKQLSDLINISAPVSCQVQQVRNRYEIVKKPQPGICGNSFRRIIHFKDEYTIEPLKVTNLAGRDPVTGRVVAKGIGGGIKHKYHWIKWVRDGPTDLEKAPKEEVVLQIFKDGCRTSFVALVGVDRELKYILATENMKPGDILRTHCGIPRNPVRPNEGDAYPLGALPIGTQVHCVEKYPGIGGFLVHAAGTCGTIVRKDGDDRVIVQMPSKRLFSLHHTCMATVGRLSNVDHGTTPVGSIQKKRELGYRPRSGLWHRKDGRHGRKIKGPKPIKKYDASGSAINRTPTISLTINGV